jgi:AAA15 family ATPase/GTPase
MLTFFSLTNFKVFGSRQSLDLAPITLIYGPNSGGKSSIIQALLLLKQSIEAPINHGIRDRVLVPKGRYVDLGQSKSIHHKHLFSNKISFEVGMRFPGIINKSLSPIFSNSEEFSVSMNFEHRDDTIKLRLPALTGIRYRSKTLRKFDLDISLSRGVKQNQAQHDEQIEFEELNDIKSPTNFFIFSNLEEIRKFNEFLKFIPRIRAEQSDTDFFGLSEISEEKQKNRFQIGFRPFVSGKTTYLPTSIKNLAKPDSEKRFLTDNYLDIPSSALTQVARMMNLQFEKMCYLGPLRSRPKRLYELSQQYQGSIGLSGEFSVEALRSETQTENSEEINVIDFVNAWLKKFEVPYTVSVEDVGDEVLGDLA